MCAAVTCGADRRFEELRAAHGSFFAYHGSALENWHSIVSNGFCGHLNR